MSDFPPPLSRADARAQARASRAGAKAMRPWYRRKRFWLLGIVAIVVVGAVAGSGGGDDDKADVPSVSKGLGTKDASADVGPVTMDAAAGGLRKVRVTITNNSSGRSNYVVQVAAESADGGTQYDATGFVVTNLEPGQSSPQESFFTKDIPADAKLVVKSVQRNSAG